MTGKKKISIKSSVRMHQYRTMKILKMMKTLCKKTKARGVTIQENSLKRLKKLRKWMEILNPAMKVNMESFREFDL